jgi:MoaA/NifB/PqqE/SkfB family radical SAM enzyme
MSTMTINHFMRDAARVTLREPSLAYFFVKTAAQQRKAAALRRSWQEQGVHVPPLMTVSVSRQGDLHVVLTEARHLGVSFVALAGGEPLIRPELLDVAARFPEIVFMLTTNGSLIDDAVLDTLERNRHILPIVSLEGLERNTDHRRDDGVYGVATAAMERMRSRGLFFGASITITWPNFPLTTSRAFVRRLVDVGCRVFFYVDYVPMQAGTEHLMPSLSQRKSEALTMALLRREFRALFLASPASEQVFGGCMAAGEGDSDEHLGETSGGYAVLAKRDRLESISGMSSDAEPLPERLIA